MDLDLEVMVVGGCMVDNGSEGIAFRIEAFITFTIFNSCSFL